ncbi:MAG: VCBS repeat-containing protein [Cyclobacteriaceae bacterium]|nr:VCBS repeat-containing protein [Cyclobacteriaceae bacterium]
MENIIKTCLSKKYFLPCVLLLLTGCNTSENNSDKNTQSATGIFERVRYNNPGAISDIGIGLKAWPVPVDYDKDGDLDLVVSCNDVPFNGTYFFENKSGEIFPVFEPPVRIGEGKDNIQPSYTNGELHLMGHGIEFESFTDSLYASPRRIMNTDIFDSLHIKINTRQWNWVDYEGDGDDDLIVGIDEWGEYGWEDAYNDQGEWTNGPLHGFVYLIENTDGQFRLKGKLEAGGSPIDVYGAPSPNMQDFDGDGDLDIICGEFIEKLTWFENTGTRQRPRYAEGRQLENENGFIVMDLELFVPVSLDWDHDGDVDLIVGTEDGKVGYIENTGVVKNHMPQFKNLVYFQQRAEYLKFGALTTPFSVDWDNDGDEDLICGNTAGYIGYIENLDGGNPPRWANPRYLEDENGIIRIMAGPSGSIQGPCEAKWGYTTQTVADWDGDGLLDIVANSIWGKVVWFQNTGTKEHPALKAARPVLVDWKEGPPKPSWNWWNPESNELVTQMRTTPVAIDWNKDDLMDLVLLDHEGYLSFFEGFEKNKQHWLKPGRRIFYEDQFSNYNRLGQIVDSLSGPIRLNVDMAGKSGRRKLCLGDWDNDGDIDLLANSLNTSWFENISTTNDKVQLKFHGNFNEQVLAGHSTGPTLVDWDKDGVKDILTGAEDGHFYLFKNK